MLHEGAVLAAVSHAVLMTIAMMQAVSHHTYYSVRST